VTRSNMVNVGERAPDARVQRGPGDDTTIASLWADGPILLVFYLFDWSST
jgi:peroxiredoxin